MHNREALKDEFQTFDGTKLVYRSWMPVSKDTKKKAIIVLHRGHEHSGRLDDLIEGIGTDGYWVFGYDGRGHGESPGERGFAPSFGHMVRDLDSFVRFVSKKYDIPVDEMLVVANSVGAVVASTWVHDYAPKIRGMVLAAPAFKVKLYVPFALAGLRTMDLIKRPMFISSYVKSKFLTHDVEQQKLYDSDPLITPQIAVNILIDLFDTSKRVVEDAGAIHVPTLVLSAEKDYVVDNKVQREFFEKLSSTRKRFVSLSGFYHGVLYEKERHQAFNECAHFIHDCFSNELEVVSLTNAHKEGYTREEYKNLYQKHPPLFDEFMFLFQKMMMKTLGWMSKGIRVGMKYGFDSGVSLDHVYKNKPEGFTWFGKIIDYFYINAIGWRGIRRRKVNLQNSVRNVVDKLLAEGKPIRIMDIASGPGRYLIELAKEYERFDFKVLLRDYSHANIDEGKRIAKSLNCTNVEFKVEDAFSRKSFETQDYTPNIVIVSGLYELFPDNDLVAESISGFTDNMQEDGYLIYTGQPWHPQLEMIANTLSNREGKKWIMRRRTQQELDQLFEVAGASKVDMEIDNWGIFTVSTAEFSKNKNTRMVS
jgi:alpha-beta hydrolase superfamily lysophospholipase/SAM-dependent methyltransferase